MKTRFDAGKFFKVMLFQFLGILMLGMTNCIGSGYPADVYRENLTLEEAQSLVTFPICMPTYVPFGIKPEPQINYDTDSPEVPELTWIRLIYKRSDYNAKVFEVSQRYTNHDSENRENAGLKAKKLIMLWWISPRLSADEINPIAEQVEIHAIPFQTDDIFWWLYEITEPTLYQSTMTTWITNHIEFQVSSFLSVGEIEKITQSMFECVR